MYIKTNDKGRVTAMYAAFKEGCVDAGAIPEPQRIDGTVAVMYWRSGKIEYEYEPVPTVQEEDARMRAAEARTA